MAVVKIGNTANTYREDLLGNSTDIKPTNFAPGSTFYETDTGISYIFDGTSWTVIL